MMTVHDKGSENVDWNKRLGRKDHICTRDVCRNMNMTTLLLIILMDKGVKKQLFTFNRYIVLLVLYLIFDASSGAYNTQYFFRLSCSVLGGPEAVRCLVLVIYPYPSYTWIGQI